MKISQRIRLAIGFTFVFLFLSLGFQNCGKKQDLLTVTEMDSTLSDPLKGAAPKQAKAQQEMGAAPTNAKQTLESMMSLLDLSPSDLNMTEVNAEINYRRNLLVPKSEITLLNSPSIIAITSLAGIVCKQAVVKDKKGPQDVFKFIDFKQGPKAYGRMGALNTYLSLAERMWMRKPTSEELQLMTEALEEYLKTLDSAAMESAAESEKLAIFMCTGMLSVPESYLL